ncbi:DMT family transporter [Wenxinia marina]|uniref:EamA-like transporter family n=1 Tax=Wenxinia marina DSM 24838 TaxID=1123501 RepID=A0A0D0QCP7_9RHOB|nr:DMT family transporter [Wenxinia marina]KIQ68698.1 EamA-like transporter family [Wenxinia marina DSM 24838]GGL68012.1 hypothetical protein GCM10011392_23120 [Wenxinia marina]
MTARAGGGRGRLPLIAALVGIGALWGATTPLIKISVSTGYRPFGLMFWQLAIMCVLLGAVAVTRGGGVPRGRRAWAACLFVALAGTVLPNAVSYRAATVLPAGIMAIVIATVPLFALPMAVALRIDRFAPTRLAGLALGLSGVVLIALPEAALPTPAMAAMLPLALVAPLLYAVEGNGVALLQDQVPGPLPLLLGASLIGLVLVTPVALATGQFIRPRGGLGAAEGAIAGIGLFNAVAYAGYLWMIRTGGAVWAAQVGYLVTGFGVVWSMLFLGERYSGYVWTALALMLAGLALVSPREETAPHIAAQTGTDA